MQSQKGVACKKSSGGSVPKEAVGEDRNEATPSKVGRPPTSPLDRKSQVRENVRAHREKLKASGLEKVETYLPKAWREFLQNSGEPIQQLGLQAFALLLKERGASDLVQAAQVATTGHDEAV